MLDFGPYFRMENLQIDVMVLVNIILNSSLVFSFVGRWKVREIGHARNQKLHEARTEADQPEAVFAFGCRTREPPAHLQSPFPGQNRRAGDC